MYLVTGCVYEAVAITSYLCGCFTRCLLLLLQGCLQGCLDCIVCCQVKRALFLFVLCFDIGVAFYEQLHHIEMP